MKQDRKRVAVVGAGVGGLATAVRLAHMGYDVDVFEKLPECGGRAHMIEEKGFKFDTGPSFVLMPDFFEEIFSFCGEDIQDYLDLKVLDVSYKIFYPDGETLSVYRDSSKTKEELERLEKGSSDSYEIFLKHTEKIYRSVRPLLYQCFTKKSLLDPKMWPLLVKLEPFNTYWNLAKKYFKTEKLCYAFTFEAMFMGLSPFETPAFYSVISYTDHIQKIAHPIGGMYQIPLALEKLAKNKGVQFHYDVEVKRIKEKKDSVTLVLQDKEIAYPYAVSNADYAYTQADLLKRSLPDYQYSCSVFLVYLGLKKKIRGLEHHNLFFSGDLRKNLRQIFKENVVPDDPSFYIHVPTVTDPSLAPEGKDILYILIPVANLKNKTSSFFEQEQRLKRIVYDKVKEITGENIEELIEVEHKFYPRDFISRYNIRYGATFGLAHNLMQSAFFRPANQDKKIKRLFYTGASTQPGGGLPVVLASSKIVADMISA